MNSSIPHVCAQYSNIFLILQFYLQRGFLFLSFPKHRTTLLKGWLLCFSSEMVLLLSGPPLLHKSKIFGKESCYMNEVLNYSFHHLVRKKKKKAGCFSMQFRITSAEFGQPFGRLYATSLTSAMPPSVIIILFSNRDN